MKKIQLLSYGMILLAGTFALASCEDDNDSNPTLVTPTTLTLNTPSVSGLTIDLATSETIPLSWSQPNYTDLGAPVVVTYFVQISATGNYTQEYDVNAEDNSGADYATLTETYTTCTADVSAEAIAEAMQKAAQWEEDAVPETATVHIRLKATVRDASFNEYGVIYSNTVTLTVVPYYYTLGNAEVQIWYLTGNCIADGSWSNSAAAIGTSMLPLYPSTDEAYNKADGTGILTYTGYFPASSEFKIIQYPGDWNYGICGNGTDMGTSYRNNDDDTGNITIANAGYYTITLNTSTHDCTIVATDTPSAYGQMLISGDFNGWSTEENMTAASTYDGAICHDWVYTLDTSSEDTTCKFLTDSSWTINWGAEDFPYGTGTSNGPNIPVTAGNYMIFFNDILGRYLFVTLE